MPLVVRLSASHSSALGFECLWHLIPMLLECLVQIGLLDFPGLFGLLSSMKSWRWFEQRFFESLPRPGVTVPFEVPLGPSHLPGSSKVR